MKKLLLKSTLLLCALIAGSLNGWADNFVINTTNFDKPNSGSGYAAYDGDHTINGITITSKNVMIQSAKLQFKSTPGYLYNKTAMPGSITQITIDTGANLKIYVGTSANSETTEVTSGAAITGNNTYFKVKSNGSTGTAVSITVSYSSSSSDPIPVTGISLNKDELSLAVGEKFTLTPTIAPADATNRNISWESDNEEVATVTDGEVTAVAVGTATITVTTEDGSKTATCDVTVTAAPVASATLDFTSNDDWGFPTTKTASEDSFSNGTYTIKLKGSTSTTNGYYFDTEANNLLLGKTDATLTFPIFTFNVKKIVVYGNEGASGSVTFNIFVGSEAVSTSATSSKVTHDFAIEEASQAAGTKYILKVTNNNNMRISKIEVYGYETTPAVTADGWATYVTTNPCRFEESDAYIVKSASDKVYLQSVTDVPNNTPVLLKGEGAKTANVLPSASAISNELAVSNGGSIDGYVLAKKSGVVGFYKWDGGSLTSGKVYLPSSSVTSAHDFLGFDFDEETTGVADVTNTNLTNNTNEFYNLAGQRVAKPTKGLYIMNGRKVIVK